MDSKITDSIPIIPLDEQNRFVFEQSNQEAIKQLEENLNAPVVEPLNNFDITQYSNTHLLDKNKGFESPNADIIKYYCDQLKHFDSQYTQKEIARSIFGINDRRLREYIQGKHKIPFELWQKMLIATGRKPQHVVKVIAYCK